jgi:hypothetical protein
MIQFLMMQGDSAQWAANTISMWALVISALSFCGAVVSAVIAWMQSKEAKRQAQAGERQAIAAEKTLELQARALEAQSGDTKAALELAKASATAADRSAIAAEQAVTSSLQSARAWIFARMPPNASDLSGRIEIVNFGSTAALNVTALWGHLEVADASDWSNALFEELRPEQHCFLPYPVIGSGAVEINHVPLNIHKNTISQISGGSVVCFVYGRLKYLDVYKHTHKTDVRFMYNVRSHLFEVADWDVS